MSLKKAKLLYIWDVIRCFQPYLWEKPTLNIMLFNIAMISNYLKTSVRYLLKQKGYAFINVFGLALAIGCFMVIYVFIDCVLLIEFLK